MNITEARDLYFKIVNSFGGKENEGLSKAWADYLPSQDLTMARRAADWFILDSDSAFMPSVAEFNAKVKYFQIQHSQSEASRIDSSACQQCNGLTWVSEGHDETYSPCPQCRSASYARWKEGSYRLGVTAHLDELEGPSQSYPIAARPQYPNEKPVSAERARQWREHILAKTGYVYPEENEAALADW
jgi:hypothetical protein